MLRKLLRQAKKRRIEHCAAVIVAAGRSSRMEGEDKLTADLCGRTVIDRTIAVFETSSMIDEIIIVTRPELIGYLQSLCSVRGYKKISAIVRGGDTRPQSVMIGLDYVSEKAGLVAIQDGARPLVTTEIIEETISKAISFHAAAPAVSVKDTIKTAKNHIVLQTPDRSSLFAVQTPQVFEFDLIRGALQKALAEELPLTDDCSAVEALGMSVYLSTGSEENIKITTPMDLLLAETILKRRVET